MCIFPCRGLRGLALAVLVALACLAAAPTLAADVEADWRAADAAIDRTLLGPTAQTLNEGEWSISDYEIIGLGLSYGATDWLEASVTTVLPVPIPTFGVVLSAKARAWTNRVATVSTQVVLGYAHNGEGTHVLTPALFALVDLHTPGGVLLWTSSLGVAQPFSFADGWAGRNTDRPLWSAASGPIVRVHPHVRLLVTLAALGGFGLTHRASDRGGDGVTVEPFASYSVRFSGRRFALDLGFLHYLGDRSGWMLGFPLGSLTVRF